SHPEQRLSALDRDMLGGIVPVFVVKTSDRGALERKLHRDFWLHWIGGEWFNIGMLQLIPLRTELATNHELVLDNFSIAKSLETGRAIWGNVYSAKRSALIVGQLDGRATT